MWGSPGFNPWASLFLIYINDLSTVCNYMMPLLFADDTNLFSSDYDISKVQQKVEADLNKISEWLKVNKLSLNIKKYPFYCVYKWECL